MARTLPGMAVVQARSLAGHCRVALAPAAAGAAFLLLVSACGANEVCASTSASSTAPCADLRFGSHLYNEWREVHLTATDLEELGDARYPACNAADHCQRDRFDGFAATDVWRLDGVRPARALIGLRQDSHTYVIFVRVGTDPSTLPGEWGRPGR